jgi:hypothetical protein
MIEIIDLEPIGEDDDPTLEDPVVLLVEPLPGIDVSPGVLDPTEGPPQVDMPQASLEAADGPGDSGTWHDIIQEVWENYVGDGETSIGNPEAYTDVWDIQDSENSTFTLQRCILEVLGVEVTEAELSQLPFNQPIDAGPGDEAWVPFMMSNFNNVLEYYGLEAERGIGNPEVLLSYLSQGYSMVVPVDIGELRADSVIEEAWEFVEDILQRPDGFTWVTGIDMSDPDDPQVIVNDTDRPDGAAQRYPLSRFLDAWEDGDHYFVMVR